MKLTKPRTLGRLLVDDEGTTTMKVTAQPGDLVKFDFIYAGCDLNNKLATYIGPDFILRGDGVTVKNHRVLVRGQTQSGLIDNGLLARMTVVSKVQ